MTKSILTENYGQAMRHRKMVDIFKPFIQAKIHVMSMMLPTITMVPGERFCRFEYSAENQAVIDRYDEFIDDIRRSMVMAETQRNESIQS